jgi:16S rRNA (guanine527-N7)-methyltransferase
MGAEGALARLAELGERHGLTPTQRERLAALLSLLESDPRAPTAVREPARAVNVHVADSLAALELDAVASARRVADLGSGAGVPGLVLAVALPTAELWLLDSQARKCAFLEAAVRRLELENTTVLCTRAEQWAAGRERQDLVLARALGPQPVVLEYAAPLLSPGGALVDWRGRRRAHEELSAARAAAELGMGAAAVHAVAPFAGANDHYLHVFTKVAPTPERFPRRPGVARKRPLGA